MTKFDNRFIDALDYNDVFIVPQYSDITTRNDVDTSSKLGNLKISIPIISANMDTISGTEMCKEMFYNGAIGAMHRFMSIEENVESYKQVKISGECLVSIGVNRDSKERAEALYAAGARYFVLDIAHSHSANAKEMVLWFKNHFKDTHLMVGNVASPDAVLCLEGWGADSIKVGIGPGCFAAGTRILMANGFYKNIEEIKSGEFVINKNGNPVKVVKSFSTGIRKVVKLKTNHFYKPTFVTPDHQYWIGDLNSTSQNTISSGGYVKLLDKKAKTKPKTSKYKWHKIADGGQFVSLLPKKIQFDLPDTFSIGLNKKTGGNWRGGFKYETYVSLTPSYELGYLFGTFLGDGSSRTPKNKPRESNTVDWAFGSNEINIAEKVSNCTQIIFNKKPTIKLSKEKNILKVKFSDKPFADFLSTFGKKNEKHLPSELLVNDKDYLNGIYDGLIDSDGSISKEGRISFGNTSSKLIELYNVICYILHGHFPLNEYREPNVGGLNANIDNCKKSFIARNLINYKARLTENYQVVKVLGLESQQIEVPVYDLEVECETHSFIANNSIVHNSVCLTKDVTGVTVPQFTAVMKCAEVASVPIVADGGAKSIGDAAKALGAGADFLMLGGMLAGSMETPGEIIENSDGKFKMFRGMASRDAMRVIRVENQMPTPEGKSIFVPYKGPVKNIINDIAGGLRSAFSYVNAKNLQEFQVKAKFGTRKNKT